MARTAKEKTIIHVVSEGKPAAVFVNEEAAVEYAKEKGLTVTSLGLTTAQEFYADQKARAHASLSEDAKRKLGLVARKPRAKKIETAG